jgi:hypothetical protein
MAFNTKLGVAVMNWAWRGIKVYFCGWFYSFCCGDSGKLRNESTPTLLDKDAGGLDNDSPKTSAKLQPH